MELELLYQDFEDVVSFQMSNILSAALPAFNIEETDNAFVIEEDIVIPKSPDNIPLISSIIQEAYGYQIDQNETIKPQAVYVRGGLFKYGGLTGGTLWGDGEIIYRFGGSMSNSVKSNFRSAMNDWVRATNGAVSFKEIKDNMWNIIAWGTGVSKHVAISVQDLPLAGGQATLGRCSWAHMRIDPRSTSSFGTLRHELGHVLGLHHEHSRRDRDDYIIVDRTGLNFDEISDNRAAYVYTKEFDFNSVMLYGGFGIVNGGQTRSNNSISNLDGKFVEWLYRNADFAMNRKDCGVSF